MGPRGARIVLGLTLATTATLLCVYQFYISDDAHLPSSSPHLHHHLQSQSSSFENFDPSDNQHRQSDTLRNDVMAHYYADIADVISRPEESDVKTRVEAISGRESSAGDVRQQDVVIISDDHLQRGENDVNAAAKYYVNDDVKNILRERSYVGDDASDHSDVITSGKADYARNNNVFIADHYLKPEVNEVRTAGKNDVNTAVENTPKKRSSAADTRNHNVVIGDTHSQPLQNDINTGVESVLGKADNARDNDVFIADYYLKPETNEVKMAANNHANSAVENSPKRRSSAADARNVADVHLPPERNKINAGVETVLGKADYARGNDVFTADYYLKPENNEVKMAANNYANNAAENTSKRSSAADARNHNVVDADVHLQPGENDVNTAVETISRKADYGSDSDVFITNYVLKSGETKLKTVAKDDAKTSVENITQKRRSSAAEARNHNVVFADVHSSPGESKINTGVETVLGKADYTRGNDVFIADNYLKPEANEVKMAANHYANTFVENLSRKKSSSSDVRHSSDITADAHSHPGENYFKTGVEGNPWKQSYVSDVKHRDVVIHDGIWRETDVKYTGKNYVKPFGKSDINMIGKSNSVNNVKNIPVDRSPSDNVVRDPHIVTDDVHSRTGEYGFKMIEDNDAKMTGKRASDVISGVQTSPEFRGGSGDSVRVREVSSFQKEKISPPLSSQFQTSDRWPQFSRHFFPGPIPPSPFQPDFTLHWDFNTSAFLQRPEVRGQGLKLITWMVPTRYTPPLPEPVSLRVCPEMPCRMTTNRWFQRQSAALVWAAQMMIDPTPPERSHPDQVFIFHNHEPQDPYWIWGPSFRSPAWKSDFNWTVTYRSDSDITDLYGKIVPRKSPVAKNYTAIWAGKSRTVAILVSNCVTLSRREDYITQLRQYIQVDVYGDCSDLQCQRSFDDACFKKISTEYKFFLSFENAFCRDYISEKFFRYMGADLVVVARGSNEYKNHAPAGTFINTADFHTVQALAEHLLHLDSHPEDYLHILKVKDAYQPLYEDWPIRDEEGQVMYMAYHYSAVTWCEVCRRLWHLQDYSKTIPDITRWFDQRNCYPPPDLL